MHMYIFISQHKHNRLDYVSSELFLQGYKIYYIVAKHYITEIIQTSD